MGYPSRKSPEYLDASGLSSWRTRSLEVREQWLCRGMLGTHGTSKEGGQQAGGTGAEKHNWESAIVLN